MLARIRSVLKWPVLLIALSAVAIAALVISCGGGSRPDMGAGAEDVICQCTPSANDSQDFRSAEKHILLPNVTPMETTVADMLSWLFGPDPADNTPRTGNELTLYHIATAYLQSARLMSFDCDIHLEISDVPDKKAPRLIVETPVDSEYCPNRKSLRDALARHSFQLAFLDNPSLSQAELPQALPVSVLGLAFRDFEHNRGTVEVATPWELHPAEVTLLQ